MFKKVVKSLFGDRQNKKISSLQPYVDEVNEYFNRLEPLSEPELKDYTRQFRVRLAKGETLDDIMCEAFAVVKESCRRLLGQPWLVTGHNVEWDMVPFDVQLMGAVVLHQGKIAEMATGEGKTLVAVMPMYLNALELNPEWLKLVEEKYGDDPEKWEFEPIEDVTVGKGAHLVTVNDYLSKRDAEWMSGVYEYLGLSIGCIQMEMTPEERRTQYLKDITYGTNNQFGFDYLRDNMAVQLVNRVQRGHNYVIVDEVDSVLVDEARTPLIISGPVAHSKNRYKEYRNDVYQLVRKQTVLVNGIVAKADELWEKGNTEEAALLYLKARKGAPKQRRLVRSLQDPDRLQALQRMEGVLLREKKSHELEEDLFFTLDEKEKSISLSEIGRKTLSPNDPDFFLLTDIGDEIAEIELQDIPENEKIDLRRSTYQEYSQKAEALHNIDQLLRAFQLYEKDVEYVIQDGRVVIVDQFTGRLMPGRRFSDGLHEALEAKENVEIRSETQTLATITIQNYFRMYSKLAGMTGTAETEADEFESIYNLDVVVIPTNVPVIRQDYNDQVYRTRREKYKAIVDEIQQLHSMDQPVLVGTVSVDISELLAKLLKARKIPHSVLNAKHHKQEAEIITRAGQKGAVTIATNMAGRGTDIKLAEEIKELTDRSGNTVPGGLFVIGTARHESRRIDRQLRGRGGRQGDYGASRFYLSLEDDLFRLFASEKLIDFMKKTGGEDEGEPIEHSLLTKAIQRAQKRVEEYNFGIRKHLIEYDDVVNRQREVIYDRRLQALTGEELTEEVIDMIGAVTRHILIEAIPDETEVEEWEQEKAQLLLAEISGTRFDLSSLKSGEYSPEEARNAAADKILEYYYMKKEKIGQVLSAELEKRAVLSSIDSMWREHLYGIDHLKSGINLRAYAQRDPLVEFKKEAFGLFEELLDRIDKLAVRQVLSLWPANARTGLPENRQVSGSAMHPASTIPVAGSDRGQEPQRRGGKAVTIVRENPKVGRNDPCPCGSGKKYKKCCGE
ncbi:MAG: preprotein translocase subunit SecA [Candidatus Aegiribacteria sp.]|nr:preprotein translocase subunit SecA [Candidatus Aegiribacteria sp.]